MSADCSTGCADLIATFPAALTIAGDDLGAPTFLRLLQAWPTAGELSPAGRAEIEQLARTGRHGWPHRFADRVAHALSSTDTFTARDYLVRAKADTIRLAATQLLIIAAQRRSWEKRMGELLLGPPSHGRARQPAPASGDGSQHPHGFPGCEIYLSFAGLGVTVSPPGTPVRSAITSSTASRNGFVDRRSSTFPGWLPIVGLSGANRIGTWPLLVAESHFRSWRVCHCALVVSPIGLPGCRTSGGPALAVVRR